MKQSPEKAKPEELRRKQIQTTLNELHRLQAEIYELNIPQNPHSNPPVKKQIKQLAYLYENMTKPKTKNELNVSLQDIENTFKLIEPNGDERATSIDSKKLNNVMKKLFGSELQLGLIKKGDKGSRLASNQLYEFINFNEFDNFDPLKETYSIFVDQDGKFNAKKFVQYSELLGLPPITNQTIFKETLGLNAQNQLSFQKFTQVMKKKQL